MDLGVSKCTLYCMSVSEPTKILDFLYIGTDENARDMVLLKELQITHVVNTIDGHIKGEPSRRKLYGAQIKYCNFLAQDRQFYYVMQHFNEVYEFIEDARLHNGIVLVHCSLGVNRSGTLAAAYVMLHKQQGPLTTVQEIKAKRGYLLTNPGFQQQLIHYANKRGLLMRDRHLIGESNAGSATKASLSG